MFFCPFFHSTHSVDDENSPNAHSKCQLELCLVEIRLSVRWNYDFNNVDVFREQFHTISFAPRSAVLDNFHMGIVKMCNVAMEQEAEWKRFLVKMGFFFMCQISYEPFCWFIYARFANCVTWRWCLWVARSGRRVIIHFSPSTWITRDWILTCFRALSPVGAFMVGNFQFSLRRESAQRMEHAGAADDFTRGIFFSFHFSRSFCRPR